MTASEAWALFGATARVGFEVSATCVVWMCVYWQFVILRGLSDPSVEICGTGAAMLTFTLAAFWGMPLVMLLYDAVQSYRGKLPRPIKWLRTLPAATAVLLTPMLLFFG